MGSLQDFDSMPSELNINKCALKLLGFEIGTFTDQELLEFLSRHVPASAIKALFYDSYNNFYVLHLNNIAYTSLLVGRTLEFSAHHIAFLPLLNCFLVGNVYPSLSNNDMSEIFGKFGKVFDVANHHIMPNSYKFSHVLSGTREVSFLLTGTESEVIVPQNVEHHPYIFHAEPLCVGCHAHGHSLLNCPDKLEEEDLGPKDCRSFGDVMVKEMTIEVENVKTVDNIQFDKFMENTLAEKSKESIHTEKQEENSLPERELLLQEQENKLLETQVENMSCEESAENVVTGANDIQDETGVVQRQEMPLLVPEVSNNQPESTETDVVEQKPNIELIDF